MMALLVMLLTVGCILVVMLSLWILIKNVLIDVPPAITHKVKFRTLHCAFQLMITWSLLPVRKDPNVLVTNLRFGTINVRLFRPKAVSSSPRRGIIFYHGGGAVIGGLDVYHNLCSFLSKKSDSVVLLVGYRKLPHYHYPVSLQDCLSATIHFLKSSQLYGVDPSRIVVSGDSVGGAAVAFITQALNTNFPILTKDNMIMCFCRYLRIDSSWQDALLKGACISDHIWEKYKKWLSSDNLPERFRNKDYQPEIFALFNEAAYLETRHIFEVANAPLMADDQIISQLPEALVVTCEWDILRDDGLLYKKRLEDQGVPVTWFHAEDGFHGCLIFFDSMLFNFPCSEKVLNATVKYLKEI
ncbi:arylacetamide deacetylase-like 4 family member 1 [Thomomys bottae]